MLTASQFHRKRGWGAAWARMMANLNNSNQWKSPAGWVHDSNYPSLRWPTALFPHTQPNGCRSGQAAILAD
jgi:hypothetical protein